MMVPSLISKAAAAPSKLLAKGSEAWAAGRSRLKKGGKALVGATDASPAKQGDGRQPRSSQIELLRGESVGALAGALSPFHDGSASVAVGGVAVGATADLAAGAAAPSPGAHASASSKADLAPAASAASAASSLPAEEVEVVLSEEGEGHANTPLYLLWAVACYAIAVVLLALGTDSFVHNSVSALATVRGTASRLAIRAASALLLRDSRGGAAGRHDAGSWGWGSMFGCCARQPAPPRGPVLARLRRA